MSVEFDAGQQAFRAGDLDWDADAFSVCFIDVDSGWTPDQLNDRVLDDVPAAAVVSDAVPLTGKVVDANGALDADDPTITGAQTGAQVTGFLVYHESGDPTTSTLVVYNDETPGFPFQVGDVVLNLDDGPNKILN